MSYATFVVVAVPSALALALAAWLALRMLRSQTPARIEARIRDERRR